MTETTVAPEATQEVAVKRPSFWSIADDLEAYQETLVLLTAQLAEPLLDEERSIMIADHAEVKSNIERLSAELLTKTDALAGVIRRMDADTAWLKAEETRLHDKRKSVEAAESWLKEYAVRTMVEHGIKQLKTTENTISVRGNGGLQPLVVVESAVGADFKTATISLPAIDWDDLMIQYPEAKLISVSPNNTKIRAALATGEVAGAKLEARGSHLRLT